jgi:hypothetical protein
MRATSVAAALLALAAAAPAHAQPCGTRDTPAPTLTAGQTVRGALAVEDFTLPGDRYDGSNACTGRPYDSFFYEAQAGERLTFVLESRQIDPSVTATTLWRGGGSKDVVEQRGRRGRTLTATGVVPATGRIRIQVESNVSLGRPGSTGDYTFTLRSDRPAGASSGGSADAGGSALRPGQRVSGELVAADGRLDDRSYFDDYGYTMRRGDRVTVTLRSDDFDAFLHVGRRTADGSLENNQTDDDGAGGTDARVTYTADRDGPVTIRVNTLTAGETGGYTVELETSGGGGPATGSIELRLGRPVRGELTQGDGLVDDGSFHDDYTYRARRGERLVIRLESDDFDAVLAVTGIGADGEPDNPVVDDDGGGGTNARVEYVVERDGPLLIRANSLAAGETGHYVLVVEAAGRGAAAPTPADGARVAARAIDRAASTGWTALAFAPVALARTGADARLRTAGIPALRADPMSSRATPWAMAALGIGMIFAGAAIEDTPAEPLGALVRYTGYAVIVFAPFSN